MAKGKSSPKGKKVTKKIVAKKSTPSKKIVVGLSKKERIIKAFLVSIVILQVCIIVVAVYCSVIVTLNTKA